MESSVSCADRARQDRTAQVILCHHQLTAAHMEEEVMMMMGDGCHDQIGDRSEISDVEGRGNVRSRYVQ